MVRNKTSKFEVVVVVDHDDPFGSTVELPPPSGKGEVASLKRLVA